MADSTEQRVSALERDSELLTQAVARLTRLVEAHDKLLMGESGKGGMVLDVTLIAKSVESMVWATKIMVSGVLISFGSGMVYLAARGVMAVTQ